jgi:tRNA(fMet)-specific endonuclease VapC
MKYLLDTNICIHFLRGKFEIDAIIKNKGLENCYISEITVLELRYGAENSSDKTKSHKAVDVFLKGIVIIPIYGSIKKYAEENKEEIIKRSKLHRNKNKEYILQENILLDSIKEFILEIKDKSHNINSILTITNTYILKNISNNI